MTAGVVAVARSPDHRFSKISAPSIRLIAGWGVEGDAHAGETVQHRSRVAADPTQPNLRQVHLIAAELYEELQAKMIHVKHGDLGENIVTQGLDLLTLPRDTVLRLGDEATVRITGLRNPCRQLDKFQPGLMQAVLGHGTAGELELRCGVMGVVEVGGEVQVGDTVTVQRPAGEWMTLERV